MAKKKILTEKERVSNDLLVAAGKFIEAHGGAAIVAGNIGIMNAEPLRPANFYLVIKITGRRPALVAQSPQEAE